MYLALGPAGPGRPAGRSGHRPSHPPRGLRGLAGDGASVLSHRCERPAPHGLARTAGRRTVGRAAAEELGPFRGWHRALGALWPIVVPAALLGAHDPAGLRAS